MQSMVIGVDLGTSSVKVVFWQTDTRQVAAQGSADYPVLNPRPGFAEQDPEAWWQATLAAIRECQQAAPDAEIAGIGVCGQMHGLVLLDGDQQVVRPAIIWADARSSEAVDAINAYQRAAQLTTPGPVAAGFMAASLRWLSQHEPSALERAAVCLLPKDYIVWRLTGLYATEHSDASASGLYDLRAGDWSPELLAFCGVSREHMPPIRESAEVVGAVQQSVADEWRSGRAVPVVAGSADLPAQALGHNVVAPGTLLITVGTGGQVMTPTTQTAPDPAGRYYLFRHTLPDRHYVQAAILSAGLSLRWFRDVLGAIDDETFTQAIEEAAQGSPGADGLLFLPYLAGERSPHMNPDAAGAWIGLRLHHGRVHLMRAILEGVGFAIKDCLAMIDSTPQRVILTGGATRSPGWTQILADIWNLPLHLPTSEGLNGAIGSALLAGVGAGVYADVAEAAAQLSSEARVVEPQQPGAYTERYAQFRRMYPLLREEMKGLRG